MKIAVAGCAHGELDNIYDTITYIEKQKNINIDLLLCCGDFQAHRNLEDLNSMASSEKFKLLRSFYKYYSGEKLAPKLTIFIGGNHESSTYLQELPYGGWAAPNIYYLGYAGVVNIAGVRIGGISGIYKQFDYRKGRFEKAPFNNSTKRSCYHLRNIDVFRLKQLSLPIQIMMSHDWPQGITDYGNVEELLKIKPFFEEDIKNNSLGSKPTAELLECLKPDFWFAAHLHVKFSALVNHGTEPECKLTKFLSLDKCLPRRKFLQILDIEHDKNCEFELKYDLEWLTILHLTNHLLSIRSAYTYLPGPESDERWVFNPTKEEMDLVLAKMQNNLVIPKNFAQTATPYSSNNESEHFSGIKVNPQTVELCNKLSIDDPIALLLKENGSDTSFSRTNTSDFESSSFMGLTDSELDTTLQSDNSISVQKTTFRTPLKLPTPTVQLTEKSDNDFLTSTPLSKAEISGNVSDAGSCANDATEPEKPEPDYLKKKFKRRNAALYDNTDDEV